MWTLFMALLAPGCSSTPTVEPPAPAQRQKAKGKQAKGKSKGKAPAPIGVAGEVFGELKLVMVTPEAPAEPAPAEPAPTEPAPTEPPAEPAPTEPPPAEPPTAVQTAAELVLTFADGQTVPIPLGKVAGTCTEQTPAPIGPVDKAVTPLWSVQCVDAANTSNIAILQAGDIVTVLRAASAATGGVEYKPVKRIRLVAGATLQRKAG